LEPNDDRYPSWISKRYIRSTRPSTRGSTLCRTWTDRRPPFVIDLSPGLRKLQKHPSGAEARSSRVSLRHG
jgi:hypothetical protein